MTVVENQREALCDTLLAADPGAPTLCEGWSVLDLAAHLVVRERRPDVMPGMFVPALAGRLGRTMAAEAARGLPAVVATLRSGPPAWSPFRVGAIDKAANLVEFVVHEEDVRRAAGQGPREGADELQEAVWAQLKQASALALRGAGVGVVAVHPDGRRQVLRAGDHPVVLTGAPIELLLRVYGRDEVAQVELDGPSLSVTRFTEARPGV